MNLINNSHPLDYISCLVFNCVNRCKISSWIVVTYSNLIKYKFNLAYSLLSDFKVESKSNSTVVMFVGSTMF